MDTGEILRTVMIAAGVLILMETVLSLSQRRLKEQFCLLWFVISILLIFSGILLKLTTWSQYISAPGTVIVLIAGLCVIWCLYFLSIHISVLSRKTQELAMHVSLLNQENERILAELNKMRQEQSTAHHGQGDEGTIIQEGGRVRE